MDAPVGRRASPNAPWWYGLAIAIALLILPVVAWFAFPSVSPGSASAAVSGSNAVGDIIGEDGSTSGPIKKRTVSGMVVDEKGEPLGGARVTVGHDGATLISTVTKHDGRFSLRGPDRALVLTASLAGRATATHDVTESGHVRDVEIVLKRSEDGPAAASGGPVSGTVVDGDGKPVAEAYVVCSSDPKLNAITDVQGGFTIPGADGCEATAAHPQHGTSPVVTLHSTGKNRIEFSSPGKISGSVIDEHGRPVTSFGIGIEGFVASNGDRDSAPFFRQRHFDSPQGEFTIDDLAPGQYILSASAEGHPPTKSRPTDVGSGERVRGVQITLGAGATLTGKVIDRQTNQPVEGVKVRLDAAAIGGSGSSATTDASGRYTLTGVPSGPFSARYTHDDYKDRIVSLDATTSSTLTQDVDLAKKGDGSGMEMTGIGATLSQGSKFVEVATVLAGGPAEAAGLKADDRIERIEGQSAASFSVNDCVQRLRGPEGTRVSVTVGRGTQHIDFTITRAKIER